MHWPLLPWVIPWIVIGNNKVKCINIQSVLHPIIMAATVATWPISQRGWAPKEALLNQCLTLVELQRKLHHHTNASGSLVCSEHEQSSVRGYVKTLCQLRNVSTAPNSKPDHPLLHAPSQWSWIKDARGFSNHLCWASKGWVKLVSSAGS